MQVARLAGQLSTRVRVNFGLRPGLGANWRPREHLSVFWHSRCVLINVIEALPKYRSAPIAPMVAPSVRIPAAQLAGAAECARVEAPALLSMSRAGQLGERAEPPMQNGLSRAFISASAPRVHSGVCALTRARASTRVTCVVHMTLAPSALCASCKLQEYHSLIVYTHTARSLGQQETRAPAI